MDLISLVIILIVIGVLLWAVDTYIPMNPTIKRIIMAIVIIAVVLWLIQVLVGPLPNIQVGR